MTLKKIHFLSFLPGVHISSPNSDSPVPLPDAKPKCEAPPPVGGAESRTANGSCEQNGSLKRPYETPNPERPQKMIKTDPDLPVDTDPTGVKED